MLEKLPEAIGHALRDRRAGLDKLVFNTCGMRSGLGMLEVTSLAFADHAPIPERYTADGEGLSPPVEWIGVPEGAGSLVLVVEDADAPTSDPLVHAIVVDIPPQDGSMHEGALKSPGHAGEDVHAGRNSYFMAGWIPPDPPRGHGQHRYAFQLFALAPGGKPFSGKPTRGEVLRAIQERGIAGGLLVGTYTRPDGSIDAGEASAAVRSTIAG